MAARRLGRQEGRRPEGVRRGIGLGQRIGHCRAGRDARAVTDAPRAVRLRRRARLRPLPVLAELAMPLLAIDGMLIVRKGPLTEADEEVRRGRSAPELLGGRLESRSGRRTGRSRRPHHRDRLEAHANPAALPSASGRAGTAATRLTIGIPEPHAPRCPVGHPRQSGRARRLRRAGDVRRALGAWRQRRLRAAAERGDPPPAGAGARAVTGNHDGAAIGTVDASWFNPDAQAAIEWTTTVLDENARAYLAALPEVRRDGELTAVHAPESRSGSTSPMRVSRPPT